MQSKMLSGRILIWLLLYHIYDKVKRVMMKSENILEQIDAAFAVWCAAGVDATELARMASIAIERKIDVMSVAPDDVAGGLAVDRKQENKNFSAVLCE